MYLAIDVGASKTLLAVFSPDGQLLGEHRFPTSKDYHKFLVDFKKTFESNFASYQLLACCCAIPGKVDRARGIGKNFGNLDWANIAVASDLGKILGGLPIYVENDANLGGLSEALLVHKKYKKVLYLTISTGIGDGIIINGKIDDGLADSEAGHMLIERDGKVQKWEDFASGRALKARYGKLAKDISDPHIWKEFAHDIALGLNELLAVIQPEVVIIGGGVGKYFDKFGDLLAQELSSHPNKMVEIPPLVKAARPEEAVIYGCYEFIKQKV